MTDFINDFYRSLVIRNRIATMEAVADNYFKLLPPTEFHREIANICDGPKHYNSIIIPAPRDHGKTTWVAQVLPIKRILNDTNTRVLIAQKSREQSRKTVRILKDVFEKNPDIIKDFGDLVDSPWEADRFYLKRSNKTLKDPTVEGVGVMGTVTGGHYDLIIIDDILDDVNAKTELTRRRVADWFRGTVMGLAEPHTQIIVICTRKHYRDVYGELLENAFFYHPSCRSDIYGHHNRCGYRAIVIEPHKVDFIMDENGVVTEIKTEGDSEVLWPDVRPLKWLLEQKYKFGEVYFNREYQNDPSGMEGLFFHDEWLRYWAWAHEWTEKHEEGPYFQIPPMEELRIFMSIDPAISTKESADYFAYVVFGMDRAQRLYLLETYTAKLEFPDQVKLLVTKSQEIHPAAIYVESIAYQDALRQQVASLGTLNIVPVKTSKDKATRAVAVMPFLEQHRILVREDQEEFLNQYRQFPSGKNDDLIDAFILGVQEIMSKHIGIADLALYTQGGKELDREYKDKGRFR